MSACRSCCAALPAGARFCPACGSPATPDESAAPPGDDLPPSATIGAELRERLETTRSEMRGERRVVAVLFADLSGFTALAEGLDAEDAGLLVRKVLHRLAADVQRYGGHVDKFIGDAVMALFGAPVAHEDDPERAVLAGLAMLQSLAEHNAVEGTALTLRVGVNLGDVVAGHLAPGPSSQYTVLGDAVNVASRLEGRAEPSTVLVSRAVRDRVAHRFDLEPLEPLRVKGKAEPLEAFRVRGLRAGARPAPAFEPRFHGREAELARVHAFLSGVAGSRAGALLLEGEPGSGKSRLVREALARWSRPVLKLELAFTAVQLPGQRPPSGELFHQLVAGLEGPNDAARAAALLGPAAAEHASGLAGLAVEGDPGGGFEAAAGAPPPLARQQRWSALAAMLRARAASIPVVVVAEDVHWIDEGARELLTLLVSSVRRHPVGLVATSRPDADAGWLAPDTERLALQPLPLEDAERLLADLVGGEVVVRPELLERGEGNPFYLTELARGLRLARPDAPASVPDTLRGLLVSRLDRLPDSARRLLEAGAVLGVRFPEPLARAVYGLEPGPVRFETALEPLVAEGIFQIHENGGRALMFRHALHQEVAYESLLLRVRRVLHETVARLGEGFFGPRAEAEAPFFARHFWEAGLRRQAAPHLWSAGRGAALRHDLPAAETFLQRLFDVLADEPDLLSDPEERAAMLETWSGVLLQRGRLAPAEERARELERMGRERERPLWRARGLELVGRVAWHRGELDSARATFEAGLGLLPEAGAETVAADLHNALGVVAYYQGDPGRALREHDAARALRRRSGDTLGLAKTELNVGNVHLELRDDLPRAEGRFRSALALAERAGDRRMSALVLNNLGRLAQERGDWGEALTLLRRAFRMLEEMGELFHAFVTLRNRAECEIALGRLEEALRHLALLREAGDPYLEPVNRVNVRLLHFDACCRAFDDGRAAAALDEACALAEELDIAEAADELAIRQGRLHVLRGEWAEAAGTFARARQAASRLNHPETERLARAHLRRAEARLGTRGTDEDLPSASDTRRPLAALIRYLEADAVAAREPTPAAASALARAADAAAEVGDLGLLRAASLAEAAVRTSLGDDPGGHAARRRAAEAVRLMQERMPAELRAGFVGHRENRGLAEAAEVDLTGASPPDAAR